MVLSLLNDEKKELQIRFRLFDDGLAFQYILPHGAGVLTWEGTEYLIPVGMNRWMQNYEPGGYEAFDGSLLRARVDDDERMDGVCPGTEPVDILGQRRVEYLYALALHEPQQMGQGTLAAAP